MKAIRVHQTGAPEVLKLEEVPDPHPGPGEVLVRARAIGVNPVDTYIRAGNYGAVKTPYTPGKDAAGEVASTGSGVTRLKTGQRVYVADCISGAYAELILCRENQVHPLADRLSFAQGAGIYVPYATAFRALFQKAHAQPGEIVLVHGASGGVGTAAVQIARAAGLTVVGTAGTDKGREVARTNGAHHVLDHHASGYLQKAMQEITAGKGFDLILEMLANVNLDNDLDVLAKGGRVVVIGNRGRGEIDARKTMARESSIIGMTLMNASEDELRPIHAALAAGFENGTLTPVVGKEMPLADAAKAHEAVMAPGAYGKIILVP
ncbi:MAG: NADPH:quinone reductase [Candidatus Sumerlaeaceae bacterium]